MNLRRAVLFLTLFSGLQLPLVAQHPELIKDESSVTYLLVHPLHKIEATSKDVAYVLNADVAKKTIRSVAAVADVTSFDSGNSNRDSHAMEVVDALSYPDVRFSSTSVAQKGDSLTVEGKLTFHGVTRPITLAGTSQWMPNKLVVEGSFAVSLTEFKIDRPSLLMIPVEDTLKFSLKAAFGWK